MFFIVIFVIVLFLMSSLLETNTIKMHSNVKLQKFMNTLSVCTYLLKDLHKQLGAGSGLLPLF